jgi:hypothetical protein
VTAWLRPAWELPSALRRAQWVLDATRTKNVLFAEVRVETVLSCTSVFPVSVSVIHGGIRARGFGHEVGILATVRL